MSEIVEFRIVLLGALGACGVVLVNVSETHQQEN